MVSTASHRARDVGGGPSAHRLPDRNANFARYPAIHYVQGRASSAVICGALIGAGSALWFNAPPHDLMGDTGSLALGGALGAIAVATKHEIVLAIVVAVRARAMSVIIQVTSYKLTGKRVFAWRRCTPFRAEGLAGIDRVVLLLDHLPSCGADRPRHAKPALRLLMRSAVKALGSPALGESRAAEACRSGSSARMPQ